MQSTGAIKDTGDTVEDIKQKVFGVIDWLTEENKKLQAENKQVQLSDKLCPIGQTNTCGYWAKQQKQIEELQKQQAIINRQAAKAKKWEDRWHRLDNTNVEAMKRLTRAKAKNKILKEAVGLLNSMIIGGEKHSDKSKKVVNQALNSNLNSKQEGK